MVEKKWFLILCVFLGTISLAGDAIALNSNSVYSSSESQQFLSIPDEQQTSLDGSTHMTIEAWVKFESLPVPGSDGADFVSKSVSDNNRRSYTFYYSTTQNTLRWVNQYDGFNGTDVGVPWIPELNVWYHVAAVKNGSLVTFYVNGYQVGDSQVASELIFNSDAPVRIGAHGNNSSYLDGLLDEVRIWNIARTQAEIQDSMQTELLGDEEGLAAYWRFNGESFEDATANNNDLTNNNGATFSTDVPFSGDPDPVEPITIVKSMSEYIQNTSMLQTDDELELELNADTTYAITGTILVSAAGNAPDFKFAFETPVGSTVSLNYVGSGKHPDAGSLLSSETPSSRIDVSKSQLMSIEVNGSITTSAGGHMRLLWSQFLQHNHAVTVLEGSTITVQAE